MKYLILFSLLLLSYCRLSAQPCESRVCDSLVIRDLLSANGINPTSYEWNNNWVGVRILPAAGSHYPPERITHLMFRGLGLQVIPSSIGRLSRLQVLDLSANYIGTLPNEIRGLDSLRSLHLQRNQLLQFPDVFDSLMLLLYLNLDSN
jgi:Leucine-rich repeat (LRR) protein